MALGTGDGDGTGGTVCVTVEASDAMAEKELLCELTVGVGSTEALDEIEPMSDATESFGEAVGKVGNADSDGANDGDASAEAVGELMFSRK